MAPIPQMNPQISPTRRRLGGELLICEAMVVVLALVCDGECSCSFYIVICSLVISFSKGKKERKEKYILKGLETQTLLPKKTSIESHPSSLGRWGLLKREAIDYSGLLVVVQTLVCDGGCGCSFVIVICNSPLIVISLKGKEKEIGKKRIEGAGDADNSSPDESTG